MLKTLVFILFFLPLTLFSQELVVMGTVFDANTGEILPFVKVQLNHSNSGALTDSLGQYFIKANTPSDSIFINLPGYNYQAHKIEANKAQIIDFSLEPTVHTIEDLTILPPDELPSVILFKKIIKNKPINDIKKLTSYEYESYNKIQVDLNNIGDKFKDRGIVKKMDIILQYLDSADNGKSYLPLLLTESVSNYYYTTNPIRKKEVLIGSKVTGVDNLNFEQFLGEMYMDMNVYDNNIIIINRTFVSPISTIARNYYQFLIIDSGFIDNKWCYQMSFKPKRDGDLTFEGTMWIHDTTFAIKSIKGIVSPNANINYIKSLQFEQNYNQVNNEAWVLTEEYVLADLNIVKKSATFGAFVRKYSSRKDYRINNPHPDDFYRSSSTVELLDSTKSRTNEWWEIHRHVPLTSAQIGITKMTDSLTNLPFYRNLQGVARLFITGYMPYGWFEFGHLHRLLSFNPVEKTRLGFSIRTSNKFSKVIELGGKLYYGFGDNQFKYGGSARINTSQKKRGVLSLFYEYDIEQIGASPKASQVGSTFGTLFRTGPLDKLTFVKKAGINFEKDIHKDFVLFTAMDLKEYVALGKANYVRVNELTGVHDTISKIRTSEVTLRLRWAKNEEFISGVFDRVSIKSKYPILSFQTIFGIKGALESDYKYQKYEFTYDHRALAGVIGYIRYGFAVGYINGTAAYPFLKVHEGNQSFYLNKNTFNKLNYFEFISDRYVDAYIENHWGGLFLDYIPKVNKLKMRFVSSARATWGMISQRHEKEMLLPPFTKQFGKIPYLEVSLGLENILNLIRIDVFYRVTHQIPGASPFGVRARIDMFF
ncbi:MAG: DUF5686 and carboxypeptidase regulatory-like domain-containing protein [Crocinitomicaceae bacterium]|nr:DUF5686 and carboxypeptidase regulatory-like domain-containing protein [Crocinitomicaceae bacterium]